MQRILILLICITVASCSSKKVNSSNEVKAVLIDNTGLDGCGWMLQLKEADTNGNENLIPLNLSDFSISLEAGKVVSVSYVSEPKMNTCMAGTTVRLLSLR